jgi:hypothetical protein
MRVAVAAARHLPAASLSGTEPADRLTLTR